MTALAGRRVAPLALLALLVAAAARADEAAPASPQGVPPEGPSRPQPSPPAVPEEGNPGATGPSRGAHLLFEGRDGSLQILNRVQFRWTHEAPDEDVQLPGTSEPGTGKGSFRIRRAKTELTGWVWKRELTYELQLSWAGPEPGASTTTPLEDFLLNYDISGDGSFQATVGQFKVPLGRQELTSSHRLQFPDRDILSGEFSRGRDIGVQLWGKLAGDKVEYRAGIFNGNPASRLENDNDRYQYNARLMFQPWGDVKYSESDLEWSPRPLLAVAGQFESNNLHGATNADDFNTRVLGVDAAFKWRGFSAFGEYFARHRTPEQSASFDSNGFHVQAGYFVVRNRLEVAARFARFDPSDAIPNDDREEIGAALNYHLRPLHLLKMQGDWRRLKDEGRSQATHEVRLQTQIVF